MRIFSLFGPTAADPNSAIRIWLLKANVFTVTQGVNFNPIPPPNLDLSQLGRVALTGDFDAISLYTYQGQNENGFSTNGSQSLITQLPNGNYAPSATADAYIKDMCPFVMDNGQLAGVIIGGNFTSLGGIEAQGVALYDPNSSKITPLPGFRQSSVIAKAILFTSEGISRVLTQQMPSHGLVRVDGLTSLLPGSTDLLTPSARRLMGTLSLVVHSRVLETRPPR